LTTALHLKSARSCWYVSVCVHAFDFDLSSNSWLAPTTLLEKLFGGNSDGPQSYGCLLSGRLDRAKKTDDKEEEFEYEH
jgi:hypothetical protein